MGSWRRFNDTFPHLDFRVGVRACTKRSACTRVKVTVLCRACCKSLRDSRNSHNCPDRGRGTRVRCGKVGGWNLMHNIDMRCDLASTCTLCILPICHPYILCCIPSCQWYHPPTKSRIYSKQRTINNKRTQSHNQSTNRLDVEASEVGPCETSIISCKKTYDIVKAQTSKRIRTDYKGIMACG
jgi:hypothetical protein